MTRRVLLLASLAVGCATEPSKRPGVGVDTDAQDDTGSAQDTGEQVIPWTQPELLGPEVASDLDPDPTTVQVALTPEPVDFFIDDWRTRNRIEVAGARYNGALPAPLIRASVGDRIVADLDNRLGTPTTIHWHGLAVPFEMDGVAWMGAPVASGDTFRYEYTVQKAGTYWYHPHFDTAAQVDRGLYGVLVVDDPDEPAFDRELVLVLDDWREDQSMPVDASHVHGAHGAEGLWTVNGLVQPKVELTAGERVRVRLLNASNQGYVQLVGTDDWPLVVIARDQGRLPEPETVDREVLAPGDRVELVWSPGADTPDSALEDAPFSLHGGAALGDPEPLLDRIVVGEADAVDALADWPVAPRSASPDPGYTDIHYTFQGSTHTDDWMINGERFPDVTVESVPFGEELVVQVRNVSATHHPFHLHGLHLEVLSRDGVAPEQFTDEDTVDIGLYETIRFRTTADNVGWWMAHCHILPHGDDGMMTVLEVTE